MEILISIIFGYLLGSIPTAFILLKVKYGQDIRNLGSGNVGTLNSFEVTNSKAVGIAVLILDLFKGILSVFVIKLIFGDQFLLPMISLVSAVFGHCYSVWLKFKGGRGLATAAGGSLLFSPFILIFWIVFWLFFHKWKKDIHLANTAASFGIMGISILFSDFMNKYTYPPAEMSFILVISLSLLMLIIISKHIEPIFKMLKEKQ